MAVELFEYNKSEPFVEVSGAVVFVKNTQPKRVATRFRVADKRAYQRGAIALSAVLCRNQELVQPIVATALFLANRADAHVPKQYDPDTIVIAPLSVEQGALAVVIPGSELSNDNVMKGVSDELVQPLEFVGIDSSKSELVHGRRLRRNRPEYVFNGFRRLSAGRSSPAARRRRCTGGDGRMSCSL